MDSSAADVAVIGGGIVGLMIARELIDSGRTVTLIDPAPASGATAVAAGMLADVDEYHFREDALAALTIEARRLWDPVIEHFGAENMGLTRGILTVGTDRGDRDTLARLRQAFHERVSAVSSPAPELDQLLTVNQAHEREPQLSNRISSAYYSEHGAAVDPVALTAAILRELRANPRFTHVSEYVVSLDRAKDEPAESAEAESGTSRSLSQAQSRAHSKAFSPITGVTLANGARVSATETVIANAIGATRLHNLPVPLPVRPVYGDILRLAPGTPKELPTQTLRALVGGRSVYLVPRSDHLVLGATMREDGRTGVSAEGIHQLLHDAHLVYPAIFNATIVRQESGARPGTPDNAPLLGRFRDPDGAPIPGVIAATGFYRHGVLLAPLAARLVIQLIDAPSSTAAGHLAPDRFRRTPGSTTSDSPSATSAKQAAARKVHA